MNRHEKHEKAQKGRRGGGESTYRFFACLSFRAFLCFLWLFPSSLPAREKKPAAFTAEQVRFYETQVVPVLKEHCWKCHTGKKPRGGLRLDSRPAVLVGGDLGPA